MKTSELIKQLKKEDPDGTSEVVVDGEPIYFVEHLEGYYDGHYEVLLQDHSQDPHYNIVGTKFTREKSKVRLHIMGYKEVLLDDPDAKMEIDESIGRWKEEIQKKVDKARAEMKKIHADVDEWDRKREI